MRNIHNKIEYGSMTITGTNGYSIDERRTSDNAFDTNSPLAAALKRRTFDLLGIFPYDESYADGIQVIQRVVGESSFLNKLCSDTSLQ